MLNSDGGSKIKRLLAIDGKTQRGNVGKNQKANHIVSAVDGKGLCLDQKRVEEKTNEIRAIPELLDSLNIKGTIITTDAMGTRTAIVENSAETGRLCTGAKGKSGKSAGRRQAVFFRRNLS